MELRVEKGNKGNYSAILARHRRLKSLKQRELAEKIGVSTRTVKFWESGERVPSEKHLILLIDVLDLPLSDEGDEALEMLKSGILIWCTELARTGAQESFEVLERLFKVREKLQRGALQGEQDSVGASPSNRQFPEVNSGDPVLDKAIETAMIKI